MIRPRKSMDDDRNKAWKLIKLLYSDIIEFCKYADWWKLKPSNIFMKFPCDNCLVSSMCQASCKKHERYIDFMWPFGGVKTSKVFLALIYLISLYLIIALVRIAYL